MNLRNLLLGTIFTLSIAFAQPAPIVIRTASGVANGEFARAVASVGDVNRDGVNDFAIAGYNEPVGEVYYAGSVRIISGRDGATIRTLVADTVQPSARFGGALAVVPDVTGDSISELAISAYFHNFSSADDGMVFLVNPATGATLRRFTAPVPVAYANFGYSVTATGDVDRDDYPELLIGSVGEGKSYLMSGRTGNLIREFIQPPLPGCVSFGWSGAALSDVTGDSIPDILIGAFCSGRVFAYNGATGNPLYTLVSGDTTDGAFGYSILPVGDISGDGRCDFAVGSPYANIDTSINAGAVYLYNGSSGALIRTLFAPAALTDAMFGYTIAQVGNELLIGAPQDGTGIDSSAGLVYRYAISSGALLETRHSPNPVTSAFFGAAIAASEASGNFGRGLLIGQPREPFGGLGSVGAAYLYVDSTHTTVSTSANAMAQSFKISSAPNPFNSQVSIRVDVRAVDHYRISIYNLNGQLISVVNDAELQPGSREFRWDAGTLASGMYYVRVNSIRSGYTSATPLMYLR